MLLRDETTLEGEHVRRFHTLTLTRASSAVFALSWTAIHPIDASSPLHGETPESLKKSQAQIVAALVGIEEATGQNVHSRHAWTAEHVLFDHRFQDILVTMPDGRRAVDYRHFHDVAPLAPLAAK